MKLSKIIVSVRRARGSESELRRESRDEPQPLCALSLWLCIRTHHAWLFSRGSRHSTQQSPSPLYLVFAHCCHSDSLLLSRRPSRSAGHTQLPASRRLSAQKKTRAPLSGGDCKWHAARLSPRARRMHAAASGHPSVLHVPTLACFWALSKGIMPVSHTSGVCALGVFQPSIPQHSGRLGCKEAALRGRWRWGCQGQGGALLASRRRHALPPPLLVPPPSPPPSH